VPHLFELLTALLEYLDFLQGGCSPRLLHLYDQYSSTALLLLVNLFILHRKIRCITRTTYIFIVWKEDASLPAMFNLLCNSANQQLLKKNFYNHYENYGWFNGSHHVPTTKSTLFVVNKDEWYTKEGRTKSMKNALYVQRYGKRHLSCWSDVKQRKIKPIALAIVELRESEGIRQAVSQSVENSVK